MLHGSSDFKRNLYGWFGVAYGEFIRMAWGSLRLEILEEILIKNGRRPEIIHPL